MSKREGQLKSAFTAEFRRQHPQYLMLLLATGGGPDRLIVGNGKVSFWEFKHATPSFRSPGRQELVCLRLVEQDIHCRYVLWWENSSGWDQRTLIVEPHIIHERKERPLVAEAWCCGFNHPWLTNDIYRVHTS